MKIKKVAVGNDFESYIEDRFCDGFNIISSDKNNRGKTIVIQSLLYALGGEPAFPFSFQYKKYCYFVEFEIDEIVYKLCKKNSVYYISCKNEILMLPGDSELKRYWNKNIKKLPSIQKDNFSKTIHMSLFIQLFSLGQDNKKTDNIQNNGYYKKEDYLNSIYDMVGIESISENIEDEIKNNQEILDAQAEIKMLKKQNKILKSKSNVSSILSPSCNDNKKEAILEKLNTLKDQISDMEYKIIRLNSRKRGWQNTLRELTSLNRTVQNATFMCFDCGSKKIKLQIDNDEEIFFDPTNSHMRKNIILSIENQINGINEDEKELSLRMKKLQEELIELLKKPEVSIQQILTYKDDFINVNEADGKISTLTDKIKTLKSKISVDNVLIESNKNYKKDVLSKLVFIMKGKYKLIDSESNPEFDSIFAKKDEIHSGSEGTVFLLSRLLSVVEVTKHKFPIIIDSFRAEELSSDNEKIVLKSFNEIQNQKIFTATLKEEEVNKYDNIDFINHLNFIKYPPRKLLSSNNTKEFLKLIEEFNLTFS